MFVRRHNIVMIIKTYRKCVPAKLKANREKQKSNDEI